MRAAFAVMAGAAAFVAYSSVAAQQSSDPQLGPAPMVTDPGDLASSDPSRVATAVAAVDRMNRQAVVDFYNTVYVPALNTSHGWTGSVAGCISGATSAAYADATMDAVNFFRAMVGLPSALPHNALNDVKSQDAALMMTANNSLNHSPPTSWLCYTAAGAEAAGKSNLALGAAGARAVALYINDPGASNTALGHRRWVLYPRQTEMGTGSTDRANDLWVIGNFGTRPATPAFVAWPPDGFVPFAVVYPRWSFSVNTDSTVSVTGASVTMTRNGAPLALTVLPNAVGFGDNTLAWEPQALTFPSGAPDQVISVAVQNVLVGGVPRNYSYTVTVIDPALSTTPEPTLSTVTPTGGRVSGGTKITLSGTNFTAPAVVTVGGAASTGVVSINATTITALTPPGIPGSASVAVTTSGGTATKTGGFTYLALPIFTDPSLQAGVTRVQAVHVTELRQRIAELRARYGLPLFPWSDPTLVAGVTVVRAVHLTELRQALAAVYAAAGEVLPVFTTPTISAGGSITAAHVGELRTSVLAIW